MDICSPVDCLEEVLNDIPDLAFAYNFDGCYLYANKAGAQFLGFEPNDLIGRHWKELDLSPEIMEHIVSRVQEVFQTGKTLCFTLNGLPRYGSRVWDISLTPLRCTRDDIVCVLSIAHDITKYV